MSFKENLRLWLVLSFCILVVTVAAIFDQLYLVYNLLLTYFAILTFIWQIPQFYAGIKELREARKNGENISLQKNTKIVNSLYILIPWILFILAAPQRKFGYHLRDGSIIGIIFTVIMSIFLVVLLFLDIFFTIFVIRNIQNPITPDEQPPQNLSIEEQAIEE